MKLVAISEAKYYGTYDVKDVYPKYRKLGERMAYNNGEYGFIHDAGARTIRRGNTTAVAMTVIINKAEVPTEEEARRRLKDVFHYENLPVTEIDRLPSSSDRTFYFEVIYSPDGFNINEARYAFTNHVDEVRQAIEADQDATIKFDINDFDTIVSQIIATFGRDHNLQAMEETSQEEGAGLRRTVFHYYPPNTEDRWTISVGAYYPTERAFIRTTKYRDRVVEAAYDTGLGLPRELKHRIINTRKPILQRGIQHPKSVVTIPYKNWLEDNEQHIEKLYRSIISKFEQLVQEGVDPRDWIRRNSDVVWREVYEFEPGLNEYRSEPSSTQMYVSYQAQLIALTEIIYDYLLDD